jgi:hypothetical protein
MVGMNGRFDWSRTTSGETGCWVYDEAARVLRLESDTPDEPDSTSVNWAVLSVVGCEESNVLLVLREVILAGRNLPVLLSRVHHNGRGYGTGWEQG